MPPAPVCSKLRQFIHDVCVKLNLLLLGIMLAIIALQVAFRNVLKIPMPWVEEASVYMMVALALYGAVFVLHEKAHLRVDRLIEYFPPKLKALVEIILMLMQAAFMLAVVWYSQDSLAQASKVEAVSLGVSMFIPYLSIPIAFFLLFLETCFQVFDAARRLLAGSHGEMS